MRGRPIIHPARSHRRPCLDQEALSRLLDGTLSTDEWAWTVAHLALCDGCYRRYRGKVRCLERSSA